jgi:flagellar hook-length control protein FliK
MTAPGTLPVAITPVVSASAADVHTVPALAAAVTAGFIPASYPVVQRAAAPAAERAVTETSALAPGAPQVPLIAPAPLAPAAAPAAVQASAPVAPAPQPALHTQLAKPLFTMATSAAGEHIMTVRVSPDELGPVTVRAHISTDGVRMELVAATDAGRDAIRAILPDLKRDLSGQGLDARLDLSSGSQQQGSAPDGRGERSATRHEPEHRRHQQQEPEQAPAENRRMYNQGPSLDVMA